MNEPTAVSRRYLFAAAASIAVAAMSLSTTRAQTNDPTTESAVPRWVATWSVAPIAQGSEFGSSRTFDNQTVRQIVHISVGGSRVRVQLSNEYGEFPLIIGSAYLALQSTGSSIVPASNRALTFRGRTSVEIPQGAVVTSDPVNLSVASNSNLAISIYVPQSTGYATYHPNGTQNAYISGPGDFSNATDFPPVREEDKSLSRYWLTFVEVLPQRRVGALAIFGDSISEGSTTTPDANRRVNDVLSRWLNPASGPVRLSVLNQATGCGRLLWDFCGPKGLSRFERDDAGDSVWIEDPGYPGALSDLLSAGAHAVCMPVDQEGMIIDRESPGRNGARLAYVTPSHQFPLGMPMSLARRHDLLAWASESLAWILEDDYDCIFRYDARPLPCLHALDPDGRVIYAGSFSKTLFPSLRLGFLIVPSDLVDGFVRARMATMFIHRSWIK